MKNNFLKYIFFAKDLNAIIESFFFDCYQTILSVVKVLILSKFSIRLPQASQKECYVLGNGPSLNDFLSDQKLYEGKDLISVNNFPSTPHYEILKPANLVFLDGAYYLASKEGLPEHAKSVVINTIDALINKTTWKLNLFLPSVARKSSVVKEIALNSNIQIHYFNYTVVKGFKTFTHLLFKNNLGMPLCQNVLGAGIFLGLNMGYKKLYVLGADHSWLKDIFVGEDNELYIQRTHFYSNKEETVSKKMESSDNKGKTTISKFLELCVKTFDVYYQLEDYSRLCNSKIYNASPGSYIDAFERIKLSPRTAK